MEVPRLGCPIVTADGVVLGVVRELEGDCFKVDASGELDYWLTLSQVLNILPDRITMRFEEPQLGAYKLDAPTPNT